MRSRYYNPEIKRFINQDVLIGSIGNSNSLNRYSYVEGNPISYTDPFGLSPYKWISAAIHTVLDIAGIFFPGADFANAVLYALEGNWIEAGKCLVFMIPGSDLLGKGATFAAKFGKGEDIVMGIVEFVDIGGHLGAPMLAAYDTGNMASDMIDKYLVNEAELSAETALEVAFLVAGAYQTYGYANILSNSVWANGVTDMVTPDVSTTGGTEGGKNPNWEAHNIVNYAKYKEVLRTAEAANPLVESLRTTGKLPSNYITKAEAMKSGWKPGKALGNFVDDAQIGGDKFLNKDSIVPNALGREWYEADVGLSNSMSRAKQAGTRLLYSNDGLLYITYDHYKTAYSIGIWK